MTLANEISKSSEDVQWLRGQGQNGQWIESDDEEEPALYRTDDFRIRIMKVLRCSKKYCHDWTRCPFAHPGEKATRRDPAFNTYTGIACPDMKRDQRCPRGHYCPYAHNVFEYWLHPTRYRTALCRDVDRCKRKICFFAHQVHEIRTNVERPYVSPEQLVHATELAAQDPRVQAEYLAAADDHRRSSKGLMTGLFNTLDEPSDTDAVAALEGLQGSNISLPSPSQENREVMQTLSSLIRGDLGPLSNPYTASKASTSNRTNGPSEGLLTGPGGLPSLEQRVRRTSSDPNRQPGRGGAPLPYRGGDSDAARGSSVGQAANSINTINEMGPTMFPDHLNTMVQVPGQSSWASQQNLANAAAHLLKDPTAKESSIWSTPRSPLEALYSTASTLSDRQASLETSHTPRSLESVYKQKLRKRLAEQHQREAAQAYSQNEHMSHQNSYAQFPSNAQREQQMALQHPLGNWAVGPHLEFARAVQQQRALQNQAALQNQQQAFLQSVQREMEAQLHSRSYQQDIRNQLHQAIHTELRNQRAQKVPQMGHVETGFDLRFGGLGEEKGLFSQPRSQLLSAHPHLLQNTALFHTAPQADGLADGLQQLQRTASEGAEVGRAGSEGRPPAVEGGSSLDDRSLEAALERMNLEAPSATTAS